MRTFVNGLQNGLRLQEIPKQRPHRKNLPLQFITKENGHRLPRRQRLNLRIRQGRPRLPDSILHKIRQPQRPPKQAQHLVHRQSPKHHNRFRQLIPKNPLTLLQISLLSP